jgi:hypothetical protein
MKLGANDPKEKIVVQIKTVSKDLNETILDKKTGKKVPNPMFGKFKYRTENSEDIYESTPQEVHDAIMSGLKAAAKGK